MLLVLPVLVLLLVVIMLLVVVLLLLPLPLRAAASAAAAAAAAAAAIAGADGYIPAYSFDLALVEVILKLMHSSGWTRHVYHCLTGFCCLPQEI